MTTMQITLSKEMREWVEKNIETGGYSNASDYMHALIQRDIKKDGLFEQIQTMIEDGIASGESNHSIDDVFNGVKNRRTSN